MEAAVDRRRIDPLVQYNQVNLLDLKLLDDVGKINDRPCETIELVTTKTSPSRTKSKAFWISGRFLADLPDTFS